MGLKTKITIAMNFISDSEKDREANNIVIEKADCGSIGLSIPMDHGELRYVSETEAKMIAYSILSLVED